MLQSHSVIRALEVEVFEVLEQILSNRAPEMKLNLQLNWFYFQNFNFPMQFLLGRRYHVVRCNFLKGPSLEDSCFKEAFSYWQKQGLEFKSLETVYALADRDQFPTLNFYDVSNVNLEIDFEVIDQLLPQQGVFILKQFDHVASEVELWSFMKPFWRGLDIQDYRFVSNQTGSAYILYGVKR